MAAVATYSATIKTAGAATAFTGEAFTNVSGNIYQITATTKRRWDGDTTPTVYDGGVPIAASGYTIEYLTGTVTLTAPPGGAVTADGEDLPMLSILLCRTLDQDRTCVLHDVTTFDSAGNTTRLPGIFDASGSFEILDILTTDLDAGAGTVKLDTILTGRTSVYLEIGMGGTSFDVYRAVLSQAASAGAVDSVKSNTITWSLDAYAAADGTIVGFVVGT